MARAYGHLVRMTKAERSLERVFVAARVLYRPQWLMEPFIVDFYLPDYGLIVEVDGETHDGAELKDWRRTAALLRRRDVRRVTRVTNAQARAGVLFEDILGGVYEHRAPLMPASPPRPLPLPKPTPTVRTRRGGAIVATKEV